MKRVIDEASLWWNCKLEESNRKATMQIPWRPENSVGLWQTYFAFHFWKVQVAFQINYLSKPRRHSYIFFAASLRCMRLLISRNWKAFLRSFCCRCWIFFLYKAVSGWTFLYADKHWLLVLSFNLRVQISSEWSAWQWSGRLGKSTVWSVCLPYCSGRELVCAFVDLQDSASMMEMQRTLREQHRSAVMVCNFQVVWGSRRQQSDLNICTNCLLE